MKAHKLRLTLAVAVAGALLGGCGGGGNGSKGIPPVSSVNPVSTGKLVFAVGTANFYGTGTGLNVVATYRQGNGLSDALVNTPTITGPFTINTNANTVPIGTAPGGLTLTPGFSFGQTDLSSTLPGGPSQSEATAKGTITGSPQAATAAGMRANLSTFGQSGGVFTNGFAPANAGISGSADSYVPYSIPLYNNTTDANETAANQLTPYGGPPAFDPDNNGMGLRDGLNTLGITIPSTGGTGAINLGIPEGFTSFDGVTVTAGTYNLSLAVPTGFNGSTPTSSTVTASATMASTTTLPTINPPALVLDGKGGGTVTLPAADFSGGITEVYVQIVDGGNGGTNCQGVRGPSFAPVYYTLVAKAAGTYTLPDTDGPNTTTTGGASGLTPSPSICTAAQNTAAAGAAAAGDNYSVQLVGLDYDMYGATYPINKSQSPTLTGANGQADITISTAATATSP